jgi:hypothetical protein
MWAAARRSWTRTSSSTLTTLSRSGTLAKTKFRQRYQIFTCILVRYPKTLADEVALMQTLSTLPSLKIGT